MAYGSGEQRVKRTDPNGNITRFYGRYVEQTNNADMTKYYWAGDQLIAKRTPNGDVLYLLQDQVHSTRVITDQQQTVIARYNYQPFGQELPSNQPDTTMRRWHGKQADADTSLIYMNARYYDTELGQFTAPDSIIPDLYEPQDLNRYSYVRNDPISRWDPTGHAPRDDNDSPFAPFGPGSSWRDAVLDTPSNCIAETRDCRITGGGPWYMWTSDPSEWAQWVGIPSPPPLISADPTHVGSNPSEWAQWPRKVGIEALRLDGTPSAPPLISVGPTKKFFYDEDVIEVPGDYVDPAEELDRIKSAIAALKRGIPGARGAAVSSTIGVIPYVGPYAAAGYDFFIRDKPLSGAQNLAEEGLQHYLPDSVAAAWDAYNLHKDVGGYGKLLQQRIDLERSEYWKLRQLNSPGARINWGQGWGSGPGGELTRHGKPHPRIQGR